MTKKRKCATALLATALLSYGFTLDKKEEMIPSEAELPKEVVSQKEHWGSTEPQHLGAEKEVQVEIFEEATPIPELESPPPLLIEPEALPTEPEPLPAEPEALPTEPEPLPAEPEPLPAEPDPLPTAPEALLTEPEPLPTAPEPLPATSPPQATTLSQTQADTSQSVSFITECQSNEIITENVIDDEPTQTIQLEVTQPTYTKEQLTNTSQAPEATPPDSPATSPPENILSQIQDGTYQHQGEEVIYTDNTVIHITYPPKNQEPVYFPGFGWIEPSSEPTILVEVLDMEESGVKVGNMGGS